MSSCVHPRPYRGQRKGIVAEIGTSVGGRSGRAPKRISRRLSRASVESIGSVIRFSRSLSKDKGFCRPVPNTIYRRIS